MGQEKFGLIKYDKKYIAEDGDYLYGLNEDGTARILKYLGNGAAIEVPERLDGHKVTGLNFAAFAGNTTIRSVKLPKTIRYIGKAAFWECNNLYSITIPEGVTHIDKEVFSMCKELSWVYLPESLEYLGGKAFLGNRGVITVVVPEGSYAEARCRKFGLKTLKIIYADITNT